LTNRLGLYPHRIASLFSTVSRALALVRAEEAARAAARAAGAASNARGQKGSSGEMTEGASAAAAAAGGGTARAASNSRYDALVVTRVDVLNVVRFSGPRTPLTLPKAAWWARALAHTLVAAKAQCELNLPCFDDRFWLGTRDAALRFEGLFAAFPALYDRGDACWPERLLHLYAEARVLHHDRPDDAAAAAGGTVPKGPAPWPAPRKAPLGAPVTVPGLTKLRALEPAPGVGLVSDFVDLTRFHR